MRQKLSPKERAIVARGLAAVTAGAALFLWGMAVNKNDERALARYDAHMEMQARAACGFGHHLALTPAGALACVDRDGNATLLAEVQP